MGILDTDQPAYVAYDYKVQGYWDDLRKRVTEYHNRGIKLPFDFMVFRSDYIGDMAMLKSMLENLWISDDDYQTMRASHAKVNAYESALKNSVPKEAQKEVGGPAPDAEKVGPPPDTVAESLGNQVESLAAPAKAIGMVVLCIAGAAGALYLTAKTGGKK